MRECQLNKFDRLSRGCRVCSYTTKAANNNGVALYHPFFQFYQLRTKEASYFALVLLNEPSLDKTNNLGLQPGRTQTSLYNNRSRLEA